MLEARPGAFIFIGNGDSATLHHPAYDFNDEALPYGMSYWVELVETRARAVAPLGVEQRCRPPTFGYWRAAKVTSSQRLQNARKRLGCLCGPSGQRTPNALERFPRAHA